MRIAREEIFGPVLTAMTFRTPDEAVAKANNSPYGLSAGVWTEKGSRAMGMAAALRAGVIWDNTFNRFDPAASFGGYKESGFGREGGPSGHGGLPASTDDEAVGAMSHLAVAKTYKLFIGGAFPRSESGRTYRASATPTAASWPTRRWPPARTPGTRWSPPARASAPGPRRRRTTAGQVIYRIAEMLEGRRAEFVELIMTSSGRHGDGGRRPRSTPRSTGWCTTPAGPTSWPPCFGSANPVSGPVLLLLRARADRRGRGLRARRLARCSAWSR